MLNSKTKKIVARTIVSHRVELTNDGEGTGVFVDVCVACGSVIGDAVKHVAWHLEENRAR